MKRKSFTRMLALITFLLLGVGVASAQVTNATHPTNSPYATIQAAINDPITVAGDVINVAAGTYKEQINITKGVTLIGDVANPDNVVIDGENKTTLPSDGQVRIYNPTGDVIFKGFKIINYGIHNDNIYLAILTKGNYTKTIQNCKIIGHGSALEPGWDYGLWSYNTPGELIMKDNYLGEMYHAILLEQQYGASTIENNTFDNLLTAYYPDLSGNVGGRAIEAIIYGSTDVTSLQKVSSNTFTNFKSTGVLFSGGFSGQTPRRFTNVLIENNNFNFSITDIVNLQGAISLKNVSTGTPPNNSPAGGVTADIHNNYIHVPSGNGIQVTGRNGSIGCHVNSIVGNSLLGLKADASLGPIIDATCNWWGSIDHTVIASKISGPVDYIPYLINGTDNSATTGFQPVPNSCNGYQYVKCGNKGDKVTVCHNGQQICISPSALPAHLAHGDVLGGCLGKGVEGEGEVASVPTEFSLAQNYPNPFNPTTSIAFSLPVDANVSLEVFDVLGSKVAELASGRMDAGYHSVAFDASKLSSGVYYYRLQAGDFISTKKLMLLR